MTPAARQRLTRPEPSAPVYIARVEAGLHKSTSHRGLYEKTLEELRAH